MRFLIFLFLLLTVSSATSIETWRGDTLTLNVSMKHTTHLVFDEEIISDIYPKEENLNIVRNGKNVFFRYNPFVKYKISKSSKSTKKVKDGVSYKGSPVKVWFVGKETGTNYAIKFIPTYTEEDTFYIRNKSANIEKKIAKSSNDLREKIITSLAIKASIGSLIEGFDFTTPNNQIKSNEEYTLVHSKSYKGLLYEVNIYTLEAKTSIELNEFDFLNLPTLKKVFIGLTNGWKTNLLEKEKSDIVIVSER